MLHNSESEAGDIDIEKDEAVSLALVINELILNAVKHSPDGSGAPLVSLSAGDTGVQLVIRNAVMCVPDFDIDTGKGLGTGLSLVRSLLPDDGARLAYDLDTEGFIAANLRLSFPVVLRTRQKEAV